MTKSSFKLLLILLKNGQKQKIKWYLSEKRKQSKNKTDSFSSEVEITKGIVWIKKFKRIIKDLMNLIETNHLTNMTYDHSIWSNNSIKSH